MKISTTTADVKMVAVLIFQVNPNFTIVMGLKVMCLLPVWAQISGHMRTVFSLPFLCHLFVISDKLLPTSTYLHVPPFWIDVR